MGAQATVVTVHGPLDDPDERRGHAELREALDRALAAGERHVILDMGAVPGVDSAALGILVGLLSRVRPDGGTVWIAGTRRGPSPPRHRVFPRDRDAAPQDATA